jgi:hypothetical protein
MLGEISKTVLLCVMISLFAGCTHTSVTSSKLAEPNSPVKRLSYSFSSGQSAKSGIGSDQINETMTELTALLTKRMPLVFAMNGIETETTAAAQYHLTVLPYYATYQQYGGHVGIDMRATLIDKRQLGRKLWEGSIHFHRPGLSSVNEAAADKFAKSILSNMSSDGVVHLESLAIKMPEDKAK